MSSLTKRTSVAIPDWTPTKRIPFVEPPAGYVIRFSLRFAKGTNQVYEYVALRVHNRWYTTGASCPPAGYSWRELCAFIDTESLVGLPAVWDGK